ncbi:MAG TPA: AraC family transcriptional regulator [Gemmatimonadaceae bacterium]|nr:AraC family transcriptional regulator [Gemmatimonadaceae bacterium]
MTPLLRTEAVTLARFDHPPGEAHVDPVREASTRHSINFVEGGAFTVELEGMHHRLEPGSVFVTRRGMEFACRHDDECPSDECLAVSFTDEAVDELLTAGLAPLQPPHAHASPRTRFLRHRLATCGSGEGIRLELIAGALFESLGRVPAPPPGRGALETTDVMQRMARVAELIESDFARDLTLRELASAAHMSTFHFARSFRACAGVPPHRYLTAVRLRHAARLLAQGASVTATCYDVGFATLGHFVTSFRRRFGVVPSAVRHGAGASVIRAAVASPLWSRPPHSTATPR